MTKIEEYIKAHNISQYELARRLNITQPAVNRIIKKGITNLKQAEKYGIALNINPFFLLENITKSNKK